MSPGACHACVQRQRPHSHTYHTPTHHPPPPPHNSQLTTHPSQPRAPNSLFATNLGRARPPAFPLRERQSILCAHSAQSWPPTTRMCCKYN
eukprot:scaffold1534_cov122-Isochrysis_galbana.AAC.4